MTGVSCSFPFPAMYYPTLPLAFFVCTDNAGLMLPVLDGAAPGDIVVALPRLQAIIDGVLL